MTFEFTREQREAWRVLKPCYDKAAGHDTINGNNWSGVVTSQEFDAAAARFDAREATCGIEPLSEKHFALGVCSKGNYYWSWFSPNKVCKTLIDNKLIARVENDGNFIGHTLTDRGREVLAALNAMCKVQA